MTGKSWTELCKIEADETVILFAAEQSIYLRDFNLEEDTIVAAGWGFEIREDLFANAI